MEGERFFREKYKKSWMKISKNAQESHIYHMDSIKGKESFHASMAWTHLKEWMWLPVEGEYPNELPPLPNKFKGLL